MANAGSMPFIREIGGPPTRNTNKVWKKAPEYPPSATYPEGLWVRHCSMCKEPRAEIRFPGDTYGGKNSTCFICRGQPNSIHIYPSPMRIHATKEEAIKAVRMGVLKHSSHPNSIAAAEEATRLERTFRYDDVDL